VLDPLRRFFDSTCIVSFIYNFKSNEPATLKLKSSKRVKSESAKDLFYVLSIKVSAEDVNEGNEGHY
jgi:hypothetical protein